jgi:hypothetical protein
MFVYPPGTLGSVYQTVPGVPEVKPGGYSKLSTNLVVGLT